MKSRLVKSAFLKHVGLLALCATFAAASVFAANEETAKEDSAKTEDVKSEDVQTEDNASDETNAETANTSVRRSRSNTTAPITNPKFDPEAERVGLFDGLKEGQLTVKVLAKDAKGGNMLIENKTDQPLTVELPESFAAVHVLKQYGGGGYGGGGGGGMGGMGGGMGGGGMGGGQAMGGGMGGGMMGGGMGGMGGGMGGMGGGGGGFFSVPAEKIVSVPYHSVCLEHGKPEPSPGKTYVIMETEKYTKNLQLRKLLDLVGTRRINPDVAQAAAWHLTDEMSWRELAAKRREFAGGRPATPYFAPLALLRAQQLVAFAEGEVREELRNKAKAKDGDAEPPRRAAPRRGVRARIRR